MKTFKKLFCFLMIGSIAMIVHSQEPVADVFEMMERINRVDKNALWPGFRPGEIPTAIFDGVNTYLFKHPAPPEKFIPLGEQKEAFVFKGQHNQVRGNSRVQLNGVWTATSTLRSHSRLTGEKYTLQNMAGIIVHEQFHVFQKLKHPEWSPNDGYLFNYPLDTQEMLALRNMEIEAFSRAAAAQTRKEISEWAREALRWRDKRHKLLDEALGRYEGELQRFEGLAEYIEYQAGEKDMKRNPVDPGFAPAAIRHLGYTLGRWMAHILDRLEPQWKEIVESGRTDYLHEILEAAVSSSDMTHMFSDKQQESFFQRAREAMENRRIVVRDLRQEFDSLSGYRIEIVSKGSPLRLQMFFADRTEALSQRELLHGSLLMLWNEKGSVSVRNLTSITENDGSSRVLKLTVNGIGEKPVIVNRGDKIRVVAKGFQAEFSEAEVSERKNVISVVLF